MIPRPEPPRTRRLLAALTGAVLVLSALGVIGWRMSGAEPARPAAHPVPNQTARAPSSAPPSAARRSTSGARPQVGWPAALAGLDALRARAFATRNPRLLGRVYLPGPLLRADAALLARLVPAGCGLLGAHTRYASLQVTGHRTRAVVIATASLPATRVVCAGHVRARAEPVRPARLRLELRRTAGGVRIARQRVS